MGQPSIPSLNKSGQSSYWSSMWDDKSRFEISLNESLFYKNVIPNFFENFSEKRVASYMFKNDFLRNKKRIKNIFEINITQRYNYNEIASKTNQDYHKMFFSDVWVIRFQNWVLLYFFVYNPTLKNFKKIKKIKKLKKNFLNNSVQNYLNSILNLKYSKKKTYNIHSTKYNF